ncbi:DUF2326 domain-containing protein [Shewanella sp. 202IG2-18]|uniref:ABC-three component system protein n=1 Tax=Parashewanella hymeniacidonis TaxID=2807618 RepID=UPI00195FE122|nr:ABC-three component system protein [Parashewanella hymeniacidonis]MBM7074246.1 DUF2326 domain-containing protein [Parashewanella hymeniacidonis]
MFRKVYSDLPSFKNVEFHDGLNLILAEKGDKSTEGKTRNGAGKSSLVELINALLGSELRKGNILKSPQLLYNRFGLELELSGSSLTIERCGDTANKIFVKSMPDGFMPLTESDGQKYISNSEWVGVLGRETFNINEKARQIKSGPSFRALFSYFARSPKAFDSPEKTFAQQSTCSVQVALTYLLKLNWQIAREFEDIRQKDKLIKALKQASNDGSLKDIMGSASDLKTDILLKKNKVSRLKKSITEFRVLPEYQTKEARVAEISKVLSSLSASDTTDKEWLAQLERTIEEESEPDTCQVSKLFQEAEFELPELITKRFDEVSAFHNSVVSNRREHLKQEIEQINNRISKRLEEKILLDNERSEIMRLLQSHGALEQYMLLQNVLSKLDAEIELLSKKLGATANLEEKKSDLKIERHKLQKRMRIDHTEREQAISDSIIAFADLSNQLYDESGKFTIDPTDNGPKFEFDIPGKKSTGKSKMQIFCFDMTLMKLWEKEPRRPDVLVHDSAMFDGVDERQIAKALYIGSKMAKEYDFQYIVTLNSDDMPDMSMYPDFKLENYRIKLNITDSESGGLFGIRF